MNCKVCHNPDTGKVTKYKPKQGVEYTCSMCVQTMLRMKQRDWIKYVAWKAAVEKVDAWKRHAVYNV